ncbi:MAG: SUMF1/EgtB/PvdO family nonheme iron enzyme [Cyanobacteria bacterium P01_F01_bin.53]
MANDLTGLINLLPIDGNPDRVKRTGLPIHDVAERLRRSGAGNIVLILDACRNGDTRDIGLGIGVEAQQGVVTLFSCGADEVSHEIAALEHGAFTYALLEGLRLEGPKNCATVDRLSRFVRTRVGELTAEYHNRRQTPLVKAEPIEKLHLVLLPDKATVHDVAPLKKTALQAEVVGDLDTARQLWIRVLAVIRADMEAIGGLERLAVKRAKLPVTAQTLGLDGGVRTPEPVTAVPKAKVVEEQSRQVELGDGVTLELVTIPGGSFVMGSPSTEKGRDVYGNWNDALKGVDVEGPQHRVTLQPFLMGKYPVTQAQWRAVAALPKVNIELKAAPSRFTRFEGDNRPVEQVSWYEAVEFCQRLSQLTGQAYRLPSEAEWEYACRAGTTTPFHFGETLSAKLANYNAKYTYGAGVKGKYREQTTDVTSFPANDFGLHDMHGNVWEWCADHWPKNYEGAPVDGSAWISSQKDAGRLIRGGSWFSIPRYCRSAYRLSGTSVLRYFNIGFRVSCAAPRALS